MLLQWASPKVKFVRCLYLSRSHKLLFKLSRPEEGPPEAARQALTCEYAQTQRRRQSHLSTRSPFLLCTGRPQPPMSSRLSQSLAASLLKIGSSLQQLPPLQLQRSLVRLRAVVNEAAYCNFRTCYRST